MSQNRNKKNTVTKMHCGITGISRSDMQNDRPFRSTVFVKFEGCQFRQVVGILIGTNDAPLLADLFSI